jgi:hypothetical protein
MKNCLKVERTGPVRSDDDKVLGGELSRIRLPGEGDGAALSVVRWRLVEGVCCVKRCMYQGGSQLVRGGIKRRVDGRTTEFTTCKGLVVELAGLVYNLASGQGQDVSRQMV